VRLGAAHAAVSSLPGATVVAATDTDQVQVEFVVSGECVVEHDGRRTTLRTGDFTVCDRSRPLTLTPAAPATGVMALVVPKTLMPSSPGIAHLMGVRVSGRGGAGGLVSSMLARLAQEQGDYDVAEGVRISTALVDLILTSLRRVSDPTGQPAQRDVLRRGIYAYIEERLADPDLSPSMIADARHISIRYLHRLFEDGGCSVGRWIRRRRLDRCRRDLADPALADRPVGAVASRWGFVDAAHFSRSFRATYGLTPSSFRGRAFAA
jgi:AraC-like DNA-binding protein